MALQPGAGFGCSPWRERERERENGGRRRGRWAERERGPRRDCATNITVIMQRLNSRAVSFQVCREIAFMYKDAEITSFLCQKAAGDSERCVRVIFTHLQRERGGEKRVAGWVMKGKRKRAR